MSRYLPLLVLLALGSWVGVSAHVIRGLTSPTLATAFVSSPSGTPDAPIAISWGLHVTGLRVACFFVANTSPARADVPEFPRLTAVGFELPGNPRGFTLVDPLDQGWQVIEGIPVRVEQHGTMTLDVALVAVSAPDRKAADSPVKLGGIPPGQPPGRGNGTRFCLAGPFPNNPAILDPPTPLTIEEIINGVVVRFQGVGPAVSPNDIGVWENTAQRPIPLYP